MHIRIATALVFTSVLSAQQTSGGVIFGILSDSVAHLVASASITAKNNATGRDYVVTSGSTGEFRLSGLPAGEYTVSVHIDRVGDFPQTSIKVPADDSVRFDIILPLP